MSGDDVFNVKCTEKGHKRYYFKNVPLKFVETFAQHYISCADQENFLGGGGAGGGVQIPRRGLTENFNMAKINNLSIPGGGGGSGPPVQPPPPPLDPPMCKQALTGLSLA